MAEYNKERRWTAPNKRAESYANERKAKVHQHGQKEGQPLTDYEAGMRSGYLQCQSDHAGLFRYKQAIAVCALEQIKNEYDMTFVTNGGTAVAGMHISVIEQPRYYAYLGR